MLKVLGVAATVLAVWAATAAALSLGAPEAMPPAKPTYESRESLKRLSAPCALYYAHRGADGRWVQGCGK